MLESVIKKNLSGGVAAITRAQLKHLPYEIGALEPVMSGHTLDDHFGKQHRFLVNNLNNLLEQQAEATERGDLHKRLSLQK